MSTLEISGDYDDLIPPLMEEDRMNTTNSSSTMEVVNNEKKLQTNDNSVKMNINDKPKQESVTVFETIPSSVLVNVKPVSYPPTKQTRFSLATPELENELEKRIKQVIPCARIEFKPNKAEIADATIMEGNKEEQKDTCDRPTRRIGCMNFIHQDRPKEGSTSNKYIEIMFFNFDKKEEYERIKPIVVEFFKEMNTDTNVQNSYNNSIQNDIPVNHLSKRQRIQGGKHRKKTQKKKKGKSRVTKKHRSKSKRHSRK